MTSAEQRKERDDVVVWPRVTRPQWFGLQSLTSTLTGVANGRTRAKTESSKLKGDRLFALRSRLSS